MNSLVCENRVNIRSFLSDGVEGNSGWHVYLLLGLETC